MIGCFNFQDREEDFEILPPTRSTPSSSMKEFTPFRETFPWCFLSGRWAFWTYLTMASSALISKSMSTFLLYLHESIVANICFRRYQLETPSNSSSKASFFMLTALTLIDFSSLTSPPWLLENEGSLIQHLFLTNSSTVKPHTTQSVVRRVLISKCVSPLFRLWQVAWIAWILFVKKLLVEVRRSFTYACRVCTSKQVDTYGVILRFCIFRLPLGHQTNFSISCCSTGTLTR